MRVKSLCVGLLLFSALAIGGCDRTESDWKQAKDSNTIPAYTEFISEHPQSAHVDEAKTAIENLDWASAGALNTIASYSGFTKKYSQSARGSEALKRMEELDWTVADRQSTPEAYFAFHKKYPQTEHLKFSSGNVTAGIIFLVEGNNAGLGCQVSVNEKEVGIVGGEDAKRWGIAEGEGTGSLRVKTLPKADVITKKIGENWCVVGIQSQ